MKNNRERISFLAEKIRQLLEEDGLPQTVDRTFEYNHDCIFITTVIDGVEFLINLEPVK